jgi:hypothetical protein
MNEREEVESYPPRPPRLLSVPYDPRYTASTLDRPASAEAINAFRLTMRRDLATQPNPSTGGKSDA